jgi:hypothetical protein
MKRPKKIGRKKQVSSSGSAHFHQQLSKPTSPVEENLKDDSLRSEKVGYSGHMCDPRELRESWLQEQTL